jgi:hypothetical protein
MDRKAHRDNVLQWHSVFTESNETRPVCSKTERWIHLQTAWRPHKCLFMFFNLFIAFLQSTQDT